MVGLGGGGEGAPQRLDAQPGDIEGAEDGDDAEDLGEGGDQGAEAEGGGAEPDQGGGVHPDHAYQGRGAALLHAGRHGEQVGRSGRDGHDSHDAQEGGVEMRINGKRGHKTLSGEAPVRSSSGSADQASAGGAGGAGGASGVLKAASTSSSASSD
ncbi:hypothetical protein D3C81_1550250 [compost metagenome]